MWACAVNFHNYCVYTKFPRTGYGERDHPSTDCLREAINQAPNFTQSACVRQHKSTLNNIIIEAQVNPNPPIRLDFQLSNTLFSNGRCSMSKAIFQLNLEPLTFESGTVAKVEMEHKIVLISLISLSHRCIPCSFWILLLSFSLKLDLKQKSVTNRQVKEFKFPFFMLFLS